MYRMQIFWRQVPSVAALDLTEESRCFLRYGAGLHLGGEDFPSYYKQRPIHK
jgi:hypothetical protein